MTASPRRAAPRGEFPASTMFAYGESMKAGVDMLDLNVVLSADGVLMVQHDETVDRQTGASGDVGAMTAAELHSLDNAYWFTLDGVGRDHPSDAYVYRGIRTGQLGIDGMQRRVADYPDVFANGNVISTVGAFLIGASVAVFIINFVRTVRRGEPAGDDPWGGYTLEWATSSPPAHHNFTRMPRIRSERPVFDEKYAAELEARREPDDTETRRNTEDRRG